MAERKNSTGKAAETRKKNAELKKAEKELALARNKRKRLTYSVVLFAVGLLMIAFSLFSLEAVVWNAIHSFIRGMFGLSVFAVGPALIYAAVMITKDKSESVIIKKMFQLSAILLLVSGAIQIIGVGHFDDNIYAAGKELRGGGLIAYPFGYLLLWAFGRVGASIILVLIAFVFIMVMGNISLNKLLRAITFPFRKLGTHLKEQHEQNKYDEQYLEEERQNDKGQEIYARMVQAERSIVEEITKDVEKEGRVAEIRKIADSFAKTESSGETSPGETSPGELSPTRPPGYITDDIHGIDDDLPPFDLAIDEYQKEEEEDAVQREERADLLEESLNGGSTDSPSPKAMSEYDRLTALAAAAYAEHHQIYSMPEVELLDNVVNKRPQSDIQAELDANATKLIETLKSFGVLARIVGIVRGPSVTRYEIQPASGVKISKITSLTDDIALNLAAAGVRMEAPIPGKSAIGVEVPNNVVDTVIFRELVDSDDFRKTGSNLGAVIGKAISGEIIISDIAKMPHLLIAGTTGSGKSVCVNSIIMSILYRATPDEVRFMMIDPKLVEFGIYSGIPHLLTPVVTDPKKAAGALKWAVNEMTQRYTLFAENNVRDIGGYNDAAKNSDELEPMAKIVIFIDELADLMMTAAREVEESICRLAQLARAAGIHLVIATQRPTVNVVTGLIKANIPSRIALKVASQVDSRVIIDTAGADKLLGKGDMLYAPVGMPKPVRVQGCWVSIHEIERVVAFIKESFDLDYDENVIEEIERQAMMVAEKDSGKDSGVEFELDDDKLEDAIEAVIDAGKASTSFLQLKLKLGYGRAARMIEIMERMGVVGKFEGSKAREVLMTRQDWLERKINIGK